MDFSSVGAFRAPLEGFYGPFSSRLVVRVERREIYWLTAELYLTSKQMCLHDLVCTGMREQP
jgi:hypothetical protein